MGWQLRSFDIRAAFLQGKPQSDRILAIEPVCELVDALQLATNEVCKLEKGAYGLIDAPYQWFQAISEALINLGFTQVLLILVNSSLGITKLLPWKEFSDYMLMMVSVEAVNTFPRKLTYSRKSIPLVPRKSSN